MTRIRVDPEKLYSLKRRWKTASVDLEQVHNMIRQAKRKIDRQSLSSVKKAHLAGKIDRSLSKAGELSSQANMLSLRLEKIAVRFESADQPSQAAYSLSHFPNIAHHQNFLPDKNLATDYEIISFGNQCLGPESSSSPKMFWTPAPGFSEYRDLTDQDLNDLDNNFADFLLNVGEDIAHGAFFILELAAGHVPAVIFFDSKGEPLAISWMPDSLKEMMPYSVGNKRAA